MAKQKLCIGLSLSPTWLRGSAHDSTPYDAAFYIDLAQQAEAACLDFVFKPDSITLPLSQTTYAPHMGSLDPMILLSAIAAQTKKIGLVGTLSTTFVPPYLLARQLQSLHWMSQGRAGWNIVTSLDGAAAFGLDALPSSEARYARASEATELVRALWQSNQAEGVQAINHHGEFFRVNAVLNVPQHAAGSPPLFQAGASDAGRDFAASVADAIFAATPDQVAALALKNDLQQRAKAQGRHPDAVRVLPGVYLFLADTREAAASLYAKTQAQIPRARRLAALSSLLGYDCHDLSDDNIIDSKDLPPQDSPTRSRTHSDLVRRLLTQQPLTVGELLQRPEVAGSAHWQVIGTADDAVAVIKAWHDAGAIDGFIALPGGSADSCQRFFTELMPRLQQAGLAHHAYRGSTLTANLQRNTLE